MDLQFWTDVNYRLLKTVEGDDYKGINEYPLYLQVAIKGADFPATVDNLGYLTNINAM